MRPNLPILLVMICLLSACTGDQTLHENEPVKTPDVKDPFVAATETAHAMDRFLSHAAVAFDLTLRFGGKERLKGRLTLRTNSTQASIDKENGDRIIVHGDTVFHSPEMDTKGLRFAAYTWSYFFLLPYKLSDPGTLWQPYPNNSLGNTSFHTRKLSFASGTGDAPDDWYVLYADTATHLVHYAAYIVTANKSQAEAEEDPHAIQYSAYTMVDDFPIATHWDFWGWNAENGLGEHLGEAELSNVGFLEEVGDVFAVKEGFKVLE